MRTTLAKLESDHPALQGDGTLLRESIDGLIHKHRPRLDRMWAYYRNPVRANATIDASSSDRPYRQAQEWGLPPRITGVTVGEGVFESSSADDTMARKEVVIENDIGWRVDTQVDFLFGRPIVINSAVVDAARRDVIEALLRQILAANGGLVFLQKLALLGAVYGSVDVLVKFDAGAPQTPDLPCATHALRGLAPRGDATPTSPHAGPAPRGHGGADSAVVPADGSSASNDPPSLDEPSSADPGASNSSPDAIARLARMVRFEIVEPTRALPLLDDHDCRCTKAFAVVQQVPRTCADLPDQPRPKKWWVSRWTQKQQSKPVDRDRRTLLEIVTPTHWQKYDDFALVADGINTLGRLPLVHVQNTADPLGYDGASDVEPLMPLQDELNTRLSDRAYRIAMTSFRMYLGKGIDNFTDLPVAPGQQWSTDNLQANVIEFGGDPGCPSEESAIAEVREALDKLSGVSPVAAGAIKGKVGNLTSAAALRVTLMALLSRTERKRVTYGQAIGQLCELALAWLDHAGVFRTTPAERGIEIHWTNPLPSNEIERLEEARVKKTIGVPTDTILRELGYVPEPPK